MPRFAPLLEAVPAEKTAPGGAVDELGKCLLGLGFSAAARTERSAGRAAGSAEIAVRRQQHGSFSVSSLRTRPGIRETHRHVGIFLQQLQDASMSSRNDSRRRERLGEASDATLRVQAPRADEKPPTAPVRSRPGRRQRGASRGPPMVGIARLRSATRNRHHESLFAISRRLQVLFSSARSIAAGSHRPSRRRQRWRRVTPAVAGEIPSPPVNRSRTTSDFDSLRRRDSDSIWATKGFGQSNRQCLHDAIVLHLRICANTLLPGEGLSHMEFSMSRPANAGPIRRGLSFRHWSEAFFTFEARGDDGVDGPLRHRDVPE